MNLPASAYDIVPIGLGSSIYQVSHTDGTRIYKCDSERRVCTCLDFFFRHRLPEGECKHLRMVDGYIAQCDIENEPDLCFCETEEVIREREMEEIRQEQSELHSRWLRGDL